MQRQRITMKRFTITMAGLALSGTALADPLPLSINVGNSPNDLTGERLRSAFANPMTAVNVLAAAREAPSGIASLGPDGRLLAAQAPGIPPFLALSQIGDVSGLDVRREPAANALQVKAKIGEMISVAEYASADGTVSGDACTRLSARAKSEKRSIFVPGGYWKVSCTISIDHSADTGFAIASPRVGVFGQGRSVTLWKYLGSGRAFEFKGGSTGGGHESHQAVTGLSILGTNTAGTTALDLTHIAWFKLDDVLISAFADGVKGIDVEYLRAINTAIRFNTRGVTMAGRANDPLQTADPTSSDANSHTWVSSTIGNNGEFGLSYTRPNSLTFVGTDIQYNGFSAPDGNNRNSARPGFGLKVLNPGTQGGVGLSMVGGYVEGNAGFADVWLRQDYAEFRYFNENVYDISATGFTRTSQTSRTAHFIAADFLAVSRPQNIRVFATFKNTGGATATGPAVGFVGEMKQGDIELDMSGSTYTPGEEVDEWMSYPLNVTRPSATSGFTATATGRWAKHWKTARVRGSITVSSTGTGGDGTIVVPLPIKPKSTGIYAPVLAVDRASGSILPAVAAPNEISFTLTVPLADGREIAFSTEYAID